METYVPSLKVMFTLLMVQIYESGGKRGENDVCSDE